MKLLLATARRYADQIVVALGPFCERIEVAGSIRRGRPFVNDIDLVIIPKDVAGLAERACENCTPVISGDGNISLRTRTSVQIDLFFAHGPVKDLFETKPTNWGTLLLCRTGSTEHNIFLSTRATDFGLHWNPHHGVFDARNRLIASETEEAVFAALQLDFISPSDREVPRPYACPPPGGRLATADTHAPGAPSCSQQQQGGQMQ